MTQCRLVVKVLVTLYLLQHYECIKHNVTKKSIEGRYKIPKISTPAKKNTLQKLLSSNTKVSNETLSNKEFNNTKRWLESSFSHGFHSSNNLDDSSLDSMYEYKTDSRQNFVTGNGEESYGNDMDAYLKPGIGDYPSDMDGIDDSLKMYGTDASNLHHQTPSNTAAFSSQGHSTGGSSLDDTMLTDLLNKNLESTESGKMENTKGDNLQKFASGVESNSNSASIVSDAINQDEVSPAKVIDNALTNIEQEAAKLMKESRNAHGSGSGDVDEATSSLNSADALKPKGETKEGDMTSAAHSHANDMNKALKEATENAPEDDSVTVLLDQKEEASGSGESSSESKIKQAKEVKVSKMFKDEKNKHKIQAKHVKGTRRQEDSMYQVNPLYSEGYDVDSAVKTHQVSPKLVSSIKQAIKGMDEEETGTKLSPVNEAGQGQNEADLEGGAMLPSEQQNTKSYKEIQQHQNEIHVEPAKQSRFEENANEALIHVKESKFDKEADEKEASDKESESDKNEDGKGAGKGHNKKQNKFNDIEKEKEETSKIKNEKGHKVTKANKEKNRAKEKKVAEEDNFNHQSPNEPEEESQNVKQGESSAENNDGGDLLEDNLMKMDKKKLVKLLAKFMRENKKKGTDSEKNHQTNVGLGNGGGLQAPFGIHPLLLGVTGGGHKASSGSGGSQFVYMNELPSKPIKVDQPSEEELTEKSHSSKIDHDPYVDIGSSDPTDGDKAVQSHNRQKVTSSKEEEKSGGSADKEEKEEKESKEDSKEKETKNEDKVSEDKTESKVNYSKEESKEDDGKANETKVNEAKEDEASETKEDAKVSEAKEDDKASESKEDGKAVEDSKESEAKEDAKASGAKEDAKVNKAEQEEQEKAQHLISDQSLLKDEKDKEESEKSEGEKGDKVVASLSKSKEEDSVDEQHLVNKIMEKEKDYTNKLAADIHQHLSGANSEPANDEDSGNKEAEKNSESMSAAEEVEKLSSSNDENIKKLIQKIKEKLVEKSKKKQHHGQTANRYDDVYAEIGSFGKRDHGIVKKSFKRHRHAF